jgi:uncharacterized protein
MSHPEPNKVSRTITLEEHFATSAFLAGPGSALKNQVQANQNNFSSEGSQLIDQLCDLDNNRIRDMDAAGIDMQILSLTAPGVEQVNADEAVPMARDANDFLAEAIRRHPDRFGGFATLPTIVPDIAADELERAIHTLGFNGAVINGHTQGRYLDDPFFWPILERAEALQVPIYLHPTPPPPAVIAASYTGNYSPEVTYGLATSGWGWHIETGLHVLRLILGGAFDRFPQLQVIIGHLGEALPFMLSRVDYRLPQATTQLDRPIRAYLRENLYYTISGLNYLPPFLNMFFEVGISRIMFSADYPYSSMVEAQSFLSQLPISPADKEQIAHGNAEQLLHV